MQATIIKIDRQREYITVEIRGSAWGNIYGLDLFHHPDLINTLRVGDQIQVDRQVNNPFLVPTAK